MVRVKVCGVRSVDDARRCADAGVDALGVNFWPGTPRCCDQATARAIQQAVGEQVCVVGVFVDATIDEIARVRAATGIGWVQLHGAEPPEVLECLRPHAYKALRVFVTPVDAAADLYAGELLLLDAARPGMVGGTGQTFDWKLAASIAARRKVILAGGLDASNVGRAVSLVRPWAVDVASSVESSPGVKDEPRVRAFVGAVRQAE